MTQTLPDQSAVFGEIAAGLNNGMPPFRRVQIDFDSGADLREWAARFGIDIPATVGQPYPNPGLADPSQASWWLIDEAREWRGLSVRLHSLDPITDEQRQRWIDSGWAARMAAHEQRKAAKPEEAANATSVSGAR